MKERRRITFTSLRSKPVLLSVLLAVAATGAAAAALGAKAGAEARTSLRGTIALTGATCLCPSAREQVYLLHLASGHLSRLTHGPVNHWALGWSPDGSRLLVGEFGRGGKGFGLYSVRADGSSEVRLTKLGGEGLWSPDGKRVAFLGPAARARTSRLYVVNADGTHRRLLARIADENVGFFDGSFSWSPSGRSIVFMSGRSGLSTVTTSGRPIVRRIFHRTPHAGLPGAMQPTWSPDGTRIAFTIPVKTSTSIAVMRRDGSHLEVLHHQGHGPVWSPNSSWIAFRSEDPGGSADSVMHPNGTRANAWISSWSGITFSPNSAKIAYVGGGAHNPNGDLYVANATGSGPVVTVGALRAGHRVIHVQGLHFHLPLWQGGTATTESG